MLLNLLMEKGLVPAGNSPANSLSAMLSQAKGEFKPHGRAGWTLIDGADPSARNTEAADADPTKETSTASMSPA